MINSATVTITTTTDTTTIPTPAGFTALAAEANYVPKKRSADSPSIRGRKAAKNGASQQPLCPDAKNPKAWKRYPQAVSCAALVVEKTTVIKTISAAQVTMTAVASTNTVTVSKPAPLVMQNCRHGENTESGR